MWVIHHENRRRITKKSWIFFKNRRRITKKSWFFFKKNDFSWFWNDSSTVFVVNHSNRDLNSLSLSTESRYLLVPILWICLRVTPHVHRSPRSTVSSSTGITSLRSKLVDHISEELTIITTGSSEASISADGSHSSKVRPESSSSTRWNHTSTTRTQSPFPKCTPLYSSYFRAPNLNFFSTQLLCSGHNYQILWSDHEHHQHHHQCVFSLVGTVVSVLPLFFQQYPFPSPPVAQSCFWFLRDLWPTRTASWTASHLVYLDSHQQPRRNQQHLF